MSTRSAARKTESWKDFLYSDPDDFIVQTVKFAKGTTGRGLFVKERFEARVIGGRGEQLKLPILTT